MTSVVSIIRIFKDGLWFIIEFVKRSVVERTNGFLKLNKSLKQIYEKSRKTATKSNNHLYKLLIGAIVFPQLQALIHIHTPKRITLLDFINQKHDATAIA